MARSTLLISYGHCPPAKSPSSLDPYAPPCRGLASPSPTPPHPTRSSPQFMVKFMIGFSLAMTFILGLACLFVGAILMGILLIISSVASAVFYYYIRKKLDLCAELMALSGEADRASTGTIMWCARL